MLPKNIPFIVHAAPTEEGALPDPAAPGPTEGLLPDPPPVEGNATLPIPTVNRYERPESPLQPGTGSEPDPDVNHVEPTDDTPPEPAPKQFDEDYVKKLRAENAKWRSQLREVQASLKELTDTQTKTKTKKLKEQEKYLELVTQHESTIAEQQSTIDELQSSIRTDHRTYLIQSVASEFGAHDMRDANFAYMLENEDLFNDNDDKSLELIVNEFGKLKQQKPHLFQVEEQSQVPQQPESNNFGPAGPKTVPQLQQFNPPQPTAQVVQSDQERLERLRHRQGWRPSVFGNQKTF